MSTSEAAKILGISRVAVLKRIKKNQLKARKVGKNYVIAKEDLPIEAGGEITEIKKKLIDAAIKKALTDYRETLELLGKE
ncbi:MAG: hypothetical protein UY32_C0025G0005 [Candidatus Jorgensenbacteria bacterium GW2011_GWC1_48_8]|uniref:Helix-turn-helix domain-containing protein n=1 Tax=Candidatus Jorgensenbacteria bacterium GW2011_GWC1_48_8 TaxID=1618666 RepID=A0A0G1XW27_9BACT|nr:MAG: hypothetical protein UY32_C0025G0005 [Candidatus Jorgensenbacteria bacterium GW2011_GWC1_48_8]